MTSRRARIKGIANIPARRKNDISNSDIGVKPEPTTPEKTLQPSDNVKVEQPSPQKPNKTTESDKDVKQLSNDNDSRKNCIKTEISSQNNSQQSNLNQSSSTITDRKNELAVKLDSNNEEIEAFRTPDKNVQCTDVTNQNETQSESVVSNCEVPKSTGESCTAPDVSEKNQEGPKFARRWVPRPAVKIPAIGRRSKPAALPTKKSPANLNIENEEHVAENNDVISNVSTEIINPPRPDPPATLAINKLPSTPDLSIKIPAEPDRALASPLSPSKTLNRTRIRPSPKLVRRNSVQGSASESEDDGRRSRNRIRNDSVCSITSYTTESTPVKDHVSAVRDRINACYKIHKLFRRSEQTRKVAEARREFYQKFGTAIPDRKRLTMMDLIYYNPTSNPMPKKESRTNNESEIIETIEDEHPEEENKDEPDETNADEDATPVPQVKVGPNGEIILDEQSLVIEQTGTKKGREKLANSQIVNVDDLDRAYGIYKRPKRAKDWNVVETLRFYKTLNTVGTDFSLMLSLFPGRTRRELKIKFKKEEKINRALIDKALMNPVEFDFTELEQQLVADELALAADKEEKEKRKQRGTRQKKRKSASALAADMEEENVDDDLLEEQNVVKKPRKEKDKYSVLEDGLYELLTPMSDNEENFTNNTVRQSRPSRACRRKSKYTDGEDSEAEEEDEDTNNNDTSVENEKNDSSSREVTNNTQNINFLEENEASMIQENGIIEDENILKDNETTEEGNTNEQDGTTEDSIIEENCTETNEENGVVEPNKNKQLVPVTDEQQNCAVPNILPNDLSTVEPGSLMILSSLAADGEQVFKVFMVTPGQTKVPVNLSPDVVESLTTSLGTAETITLDLPVINDSDKSVIPDSDTAVTT